MPMRIAIMQPYLFPYIGYFQLIHAVDKFIFLDDVTYANRGWVNRNRILINNEDHFITVPLARASQNRLINTIEIDQHQTWQKKILTTVLLNYKKAPFFDAVYELVEQILVVNTTICELIFKSFTIINDYLGIKTPYIVASRCYKNQSLQSPDRLIDICQIEHADEYINPIGGTVLYEKKYFLEKNITLNFLQSRYIAYRQFTNNFIPDLSILDVMMFNSTATIQQYLQEYDLI